MCYEVVTCQFIIYGSSFVKFARAFCVACATQWEKVFHHSMRIGVLYNSEKLQKFILRRQIQRNNCDIADAYKPQGIELKTYRSEHGERERVALVSASKFIV